MSAVFFALLENRVQSFTQYLISCLISERKGAEVKFSG